ncbi:MULTISPECIES: sugar ABC transporter ATP-binding protein [Clostridia]|uniref:sugar ABC transporter ATP-binding protein n=1 Tax=Clostridia TaxID=186801 RepID=UPI000E551769|nr:MULTISPECIES: sugar ABC transporter ATP-binding protein [Clostridia]RHV65329.1 sugar ABC transporter ATP-binding protein [Roseburia sp. OM02-15]
MENKIILEAKNIVKEFNGVPALSDGNLVCRSGKITGLLGANGSGKSTISKCITGVYHKNSGTITYLEKDVNFKNPMDAKKAGIAMAFQNLSLLPDLTVWQNIVMGFEKKKGFFLDDSNAKHTAAKILEDFVPGFDYSRKVSELSPSEMQIVEVAKAISQEPKMLILDEPTAALEQSQVEILFKYMRMLADRGVGMVFTSHRMWEVMDICDDIIVFKNGEVVGRLDFDKDEKDADVIIQMITGEKKIVSEKRTYKEIPDERTIDIEHLNYKNVLKDISLHIKKGEVLGIGGLSGQGQEELLLAISGDYKDMKSRIKVNGEEVLLNAPHKAIERGILLIPGDRQKEGLMMQNSIYENHILPKTALKKEPFILPKKKYREECLESKKILSTKSDGIECPVSSLSGGNAQKVVMGKWLQVESSLIVLSDPAKGVDVGAKKDMYDIVQNIVDEKHISALLYASDNEELIDNCDRVLVMHEGCIVGELVGDEITDEALVELSMKGNHKEEEA